MQTKRILWADDEIEEFGNHRKFLEEKEGYELVTVTNGIDALEEFKKGNFDLVMLDEQMPGMTGVEALRKIKSMNTATPVIMVTKTEVYDDAISNDVADYLVKPVSILQMKASLTKLFKAEELVAERLRREYAQVNVELSNKVSAARSFDDWAALYAEIVEWEVKLEKVPDMTMLHDSVKEEANTSFAKFVKDNYEAWFDKRNAAAAPLLSHRVLSERVVPLLKEGKKVALVVIDNFRLDQWVYAKERIADGLRIVADSVCCSILPTTTQFARNAIFAGLLPAEIKKHCPTLWVDYNKKSSEESYNANEREMLADYFKRQRLNISNSYYRVGSNESGQKYVQKGNDYKSNSLNAVVFGFPDAVSHAAKENKTIKELIPDDAAYRRITNSWLQNDGSLIDVLNMLANNGYTIVLTSDHGSIRVKGERAIDITGPQEINNNLRYKAATNMKYKEKEVFAVKRPDSVGLPILRPADEYIFAAQNRFFVYPNDRNDYVRDFDDSYQHGGISLEEMLVPFVIMERK